MKFPVNVPAWTALAAAAALQGCTVIPGPGPVGPYADQSELPPKFQYVPDEAPEGRITPITTALVRTLQQFAPKGVPADVQALFGKPDPYTIGPGDVVGVIVYDHPELLPNAGAVISQSVDPTGVSVAPGFIVAGNGEISFPYVGRVKLEGLTESEASDLLARRLARNIQSPQVTVRIQSFRSRRAYVEGQVRTPGSQIFTDLPMTAAEAINRAGGIVDAGDRSSIVLTRGGRSTRIDLPALREAGHDLTDIPLRNGDTIYVGTREDTKIYVMGEVLRPTALALRGSGRLTLNEALGEAGGPSLDTSNPGQIYVIRKGVTGSPAIFQLDAKNPAALALASQFPLRPQDVVYIDPVPLVRWNRVISLILPSASAVNVGSETVDRARGW